MTSLLAALGASLVLAAVSGVALAFVHEPTPSEAHASMRAIEASPWTLVRALHAGAASAALIVAGLAAVRAFLAGERSRGVVLAGGALAGILLVAYETGAVLPWDQGAWEAWLHVRDALGLVGWRAPEGPDDAPLAAVALAHEWILPLLLAALVGWLAWRARPSAGLARGAAIGAALALALAILARPTLGPAPVPSLAVSQPQWPFLWLVPLEDAWGAPALLALPLGLALLVGVALAPVRPPVRRVVLACVVLAVAALTILALARA